MFTGIIEAVGRLSSIQAKSGDFQITIAVGKLDMSDVKLGDSIAVNGVCLTVTHFDSTQFSADVSAETINRSKLSQLNAGSSVNLEKACKPTTRLGGHIVSGHVDGVGHLVSMQANASATDYWIETPHDIAKYIAEKGSITVDGISLTVNEVVGQRFRLTIIPHTGSETNIASWVVGERLNLEVDVIARYVERLMSYKQAENSGGVTMEMLARTGYIK